MKPIFSLEPDGSIIVRVGTQSNCAGLAIIRVQITTQPEPGITTALAAETTETEPSSFLNSLFIPSYLIPLEYQEATFWGARQAYEEFNLSPERGINFLLISGIVHPIDVRIPKFQDAGYLAIRSWLRLEIS